MSATGKLQCSGGRHDEWLVRAVSIDGSRVDPSVCRDAENGRKEPILTISAICYKVRYE